MMAMARSLDRAAARVSSALAMIAGILIAVILAVMVADVAMRNFTGSSVSGAYEVLTMMLVGVIFLGLAYAERTDSNIKLTLVTSRLPGTPAKIARIVSTIVAMLMCLWISWATWNSALLSIDRGEFQQGLLSIPIWPAKLIIAIGFTVLTLEIVLGLRRTWVSTLDSGADAREVGADER